MVKADQLVVLEGTARQIVWTRLTSMKMLCPRRQRMICAALIAGRMSLSGDTTTVATVRATPKLLYANARLSFCALRVLNVDHWLPRGELSDVAGFLSM